MRNKVLKIRCKRCENIIEIKDVQARKSDPAPPKDASVLEHQFAASFKPDPTGTAQPQGTPGLYAAVKRSAEVLEKKEIDYVHWFVAIDNAPVGPISAKKVHAHRQAGRVDDASLVWKEGMPDWAPLRDSKELVGLLAHIELEESTRAPTESAPTQKRPNLKLFTESDTSADAPLKGRRVGVIADRMDEVPGDEAAEPLPDEEEEETGAFSEAEEAWLGPDDSLTSEEESRVGKLQTLSPPRPASRTQVRINTIAAVGFFVIAVATLGVAVFGGGESAATKTSVKTVEKVIEKVVYLDRPVESAPEDGMGSGQSGAQARTRGPSQLRGKTNRNKGKTQAAGKQEGTDKRTKELMERLGLSTPGSTAPVGNASKSQAGSRSSGGGSLTSTQIKRVVDRNKSRLKACYERSLRRGEAPDDQSIRVEFNVKVGSSGIVKSTNLKGAQRIPSLNSCLQRSVKKWVFPKTGSDAQFEFPFVFTPN